MSSVHHTQSPRPQRPKHQHSKSATQVPQNPSASTTNHTNNTNTGRQSQRRSRGNRAHNGHAQNQPTSGSPSRSPANPEQSFTDSAVLSSEDMQLPSGPRTAKKHTRSQPSADRVFSPTNLPPASLTDTEGPSATPAKAQAAYAGPTFHASPAPSALPIPKFLSKSVPAKTRSGPPTPPPDESSDSGKSISPSPSPSRGAPIPVPPRNEDSPLDMLFKADRAERARNANCSPSSITASVPSNPASAHGRPQHYKQDSFSSLNAVFPIELDGESKVTHFSPPPAASPGQRAVTAPSMLPQSDNNAMPSGGSDPIQDLFNRLSMSQKKPPAATPPGTINRVPSEPQSRQSPSPFHDDRASIRSASGPTTPAPAPATQENPDFFYGNRNLSPLFKAAKNDSAKRNSGLRTEITADSPMISKGGFHDFPSISSQHPTDPNAVSRDFLEKMAIGGPAGPRRGSAPQVQPREMSHHNNRKARTPGRHNHYHNNHSRPHTNGNRPTNTAANGIVSTSVPKTSSMMSFIPASVAAKKHSTTPPLTKTPTPDNLALEQDLKRVLNLNFSGDTTGVR